jgi:hypothetical protein
MTAMLATSEQPRMDTGVTLWLNRIQAEYREMPGMSLTLLQMQRLWGFEPHDCEALIDSLVATQVLRRTAKGQYVAFGGQ